MHYGYWTKDLEVDIANLHIAQENYANFLVSHIPQNVQKILDVGCGTGQIAKKLVEMGHQVDCVSPSPFLAEYARDLLGGRSHIFECCYEQLQTENRYDVVLFGESFQYIDPQEAIKKTLSLLSSAGYMLICDVFRTDVQGTGVAAGGHRLTKFYNIISEYPLELVKDLDITEETAPNMDIQDHMLKEVVHPVADLLQKLMESRYPFTSKFLKWKYRKKIEKLCRKYFSGDRAGESFKKFKSYRLLLYKKVNSR